MATEREKERETELESAMYTNCLLLGLDGSVLGGTPSVGQFRHSNPKLGEQLLHFLLSALRGPIQSAKDFDKVWPIFDSAQSREFRKIVQGIISELEMQGALPRSSSRVSSLATCCGPRFVELLWQLSVHTLREVYKRMFSSDAASDPLPSALTDFSYLNAAALLPITKARIALERRKFVENASVAVHRQNTWSNLANEVTAEFRSLCAEEAYLQQELEKLQDMRNKAKSEAESWDDRVSSSSGQTSHLVSKATRLWESLLSRRSQHEVLASGPIEDVIAHREHRYRISGPSLLAAMQLNNNNPQERTDSLSLSSSQLISNENEDRPGLVHQPVDVAEILRRWTHALQRIHRQSLYLAKANGGEGPDLLRSSSEGETSGHAESLASTLAEHRQHLVSIQGLINQLKEAIPTIQNSISELTEEVSAVSGSEETGSDDVSDLASKFSSSMQIPSPNPNTNPPATKLPHLFSLSPNLAGKRNNAKEPQIRTQEKDTVLEEMEKEKEEREKVVVLKQQQSLGLITEKKKKKSDESQESDGYNANDIRRAVREAALAKPIIKSKSNHLVEKTSSDELSNQSEHFFMPLSSKLGKEVPVFETPTPQNQRKQKLVFGSTRTRPHKVSVPGTVPDGKMNGADLLIMDDSQDQVFSPPLLMESFSDNYEDLLAPLSETDAALMDI